ncbi:MAG: hypothetical protein JW778_04750 [Candidatus Altiarchaeota archaeon]|nr:hypothetical protein [Candidatus Altiarchaeota archaeon]
MEKLSVVVVLVILLSGCVSLREYLYSTTSPDVTSSTVTSTSTSTTSTSTTTTSTTSTTQPPLKYPELLECEKKNGYERDDCFYDVAVDRQDFTLCEEIDGNVLMTVCVAAEKKDSNICGFINDLQTRDKCLYGVAVTKKDERVCESIELDILKDTCYLKISKKKGDEKICDSIRFSTIRDMCLSDCSIREVSSDLIGSVGKDDYIEVSIETRECDGLEVSYKADLEYLSLLNQSTKKVESSEEGITFRFKCDRPCEETYLYLRVGEEEIIEKAACMGFSPTAECSIHFLANESLLDSRVTEDINVTILAEECIGEKVNYSMEPLSLYFSHWVFNGALRANSSNKVKSDLERITLYYRCNGTYDGILVKTKVGDQEVNNYAVCRVKPECSLRFLEDKSMLEANEGGVVHLTVLAEECREEEVKHSAESGWLEFVNASSGSVSSNREEISVEYRCRKSTEFLLYISINIGNEEIVRYARCMP